MSQLQDNLNEILRQKNLYLLPENIRKDLTILGVTGTFEGGSSEGIKLFNTIEEMNSSTGNVDGDLAIVYNESINNYQGIFKYDVNTWVVADTGLTANAREVINPKVFQRQKWSRDWDFKYKY